MEKHVCSLRVFVNDDVKSMNAARRGAWPEEFYERTGVDKGTASQVHVRGDPSVSKGERRGDPRLHIWMVLVICVIDVAVFGVEGLRWVVNSPELNYGLGWLRDFCFRKGGEVPDQHHLRPALRLFGLLRGRQSLFHNECRRRRESSGFLSVSIGLGRIRHHGGGILDIRCHSGGALDPLADPESRQLSPW